MSERQAPYSASDDTAITTVVPELRFVECDNAFTRIYANAAEIGSMQEESDNHFYIELHFLGPCVAPTVEGTMRTAQEWVKGEWEKFYRAIHTPQDLPLCE